MLRYALGKRLVNHLGAPSSARARIPASCRLAASSTDKPTPVLPLDFVEKEAVKKVIPIFGNGGYLALASGFLMTDPLALRSLMIIKERFVSLTDSEAEIYDAHFQASMSKFDFKKLLSCAEICTATSNTQLVEKGKQADLVLVIDGEAVVKVSADVSVPLKQGALLGEISCLQGAAASANVEATKGCKYILWKRGPLLELFGKKEGVAVKKGIELKVGRELARKLAETTSKVVAEHATVTKEHDMLLMVEYEDVVLRHMFSRLLTPDAGKSGACKRLFDDLAAYRLKEGLEDTVHAKVMQKLNINEEVVLRDGHSLQDLGKVIAMAAMPHIHKDY